MVKRLIAFCWACLLLFVLCACESEADIHEREYTSCAIVFIGDTADKGAIDSSDLVMDDDVLSTLESVLDSECVHSSVKQVYPNTEYSYNLEQMKNTELVKITVTSESKEYLKDICNEITQNFCSVAADNLPNVSIKIVEAASVVAQEP